MSELTKEEQIANAINNLTETLSEHILKEFLKLPQELQINLVLVKSVQLLLANIICQVASNKDELDKLSIEQGQQLNELTVTCAFTGYSDKFELPKH